MLYRVFCSGSKKYKKSVNETKIADFKAFSIEKISYQTSVY